MSESRPLPADLREPAAARYLGYSPYTLRLWRMQGRGPAYIRAGRSITYTIADLDAYRAKHRVETRESGPVHDDARHIRAGA
ncbi:MAG: helix-turn-helix domain-containing protein [Acidobacteria bacterium]|nr:helix-turn-helix domain-containing protein [Acidobacteriota bacterium]